MAAHKAFDPLWKSRKMSRREAYCFLASEMGISENRCHIGMFDESDCRMVVAICTEKMLGESRTEKRK